MSFIKDTFFGGAEKKAARAQVEAGDRAIQEQRAVREEARADLGPFRDVGEGVLGPLGEFVREGPETELERTRGFQDIQRSAAAGGKLRSGGTLESLTEFNSVLNARNRQQRFRELFATARLGQSAAAGQAATSLRTGENISSTQIGQGNVTAAGIIGRNNARRASIFDLARIGSGFFGGGSPGGGASGGVSV